LHLSLTEAAVVTASDDGPLSPETRHLNEYLVSEENLDPSTSC